jgi:hypothetical protein
LNRCGPGTRDDGGVSLTCRCVLAGQCCWR